MRRNPTCSNGEKLSTSISVWLLLGALASAYKGQDKLIAPDCKQQDTGVHPSAMSSGSTMTTCSIS